MQLLRQALDEGDLILNCPARNLDEILRAALSAVVASGKLAEDRLEEVLDALRARERQGSTAIGHSVAVPHAYLDALQEQVIVYIRLAEPVDLGAPDGIATRFVFVLLGPPEAVTVHIDTLMNIARLMADDEFRYDAAHADSRESLLAALDAFERRNAPLPTPKPKGPPESLQFTGRFAGGFLADLRRRLPHYGDDIRQGLHPKCIGSSLFLFFACVAPAITFGGLMFAETNGRIGAVEMLVATAGCGIAYALFSGQPLIILGGTGPMLVITGILYQLSARLNLPFLEVYLWVGLWSALLILILAFTDASCLIRYFTRFTDEIFAALISIIFIVEAVTALIDIFNREFFGSESQPSHDTALLSIILALGTFWIALNLSRFRRSRYLRPAVREFLADFGPTIAVVSTAAIAFWLRDDVALAALAVPDRIEPTFDRGWFLNPGDSTLSGWMKLAAVGPAAVVVVLVYLDQNITARIINSPDHKLTKGAAYHQDLALVGILMGVCSLFGLPWLVAATVRSLNHVHSLATIEEVTTRSGELREQIIRVRETRLSGLTIHLLVAASLLLLGYLQYIPMAVLYGLFLFMGIVSMAGNQFFERLSLWLMDADLYPRTHYIRRVPLREIHKFTLVQFICLAVLWIIKISVLGILFPLFIALLVPVRYSLNNLFKKEHLKALDAEEEPEEESERWG